MTAGLLITSITVGALGLAAGSAVAAPAGPAPMQAEPGAVCSPSAAWVSTARGDFWLSSPSSTCHLPGQAGATGGVTRVADGPLIGRRTPRLVLREGERVTFHFGAAPRSVVRLEARSGPRATRGKQYRLSPYATTWKARRGSGVLVITTRQLVRPPSQMGLPERLELATYAAAYRVVKRPPQRRAGNR